LRGPFIGHLAFKFKVRLPSKIFGNAHLLDFFHRFVQGVGKKKPKQKIAIFN
jgi:hypothetical protein